MPPNPTRAQLVRLGDALLRLQLLWTTLAAALVYLSYLGHLGPIPGWIFLALACLPLILRVARGGFAANRTPFDLPILLLLTGAVIGLSVSNDRSISLGALQCMLAVTLFYYSCVNSPPLTRVIKGVIISLAVIFLICCIIYAVAVSIIDGRPNLEILGSGTHHGFAMYLAIEAAILLGIAAFDRDKKTKLLSLGLFLIFLVITVVWTRDSLSSIVHGVSINGRWPIWQKTARLLGDSPLAGLGLGCWARTYWDTVVLDSPTIGGITHAHNAYLELYSNTGIVGALALLAALCIGMKLSIDIIRSPRNHPWYGFGLGVILACVATLVVAGLESAPMGVPLVGKDTYYYVISPIAWLLCVLLVMSHRQITKNPPPLPELQQERR